MKGINYSDEFKYSFHAQNYTKRKMLKKFFLRRNNRILCSIMGIIFLYFLTEVTPTYAEENIIITLRNFFDVGKSHGDFDYSPIKEDGIHLVEYNPEYTIDDIKNATEANLIVIDPIKMKG